MGPRRRAATSGRRRATLLGSRMPRNDRPPSPKTISGFLYVAVVLIAVALIYVAVRALLA